MTDAGIARASAWMALGTIFSRITGLLRMLLLVFVIGKSLDADIFDTANTIPNALYILVAGGIFNVVLVPQLVRSMKQDPDGGDAYANRVITLGLLVLVSATALLMIAVPLLLHVFYDGELFSAANAEQRESAQLLMLLCMPQVFFYGAFVLVGQVLNARKRFGPMMWAPIVNNLAAIAVLIAYAIAFGSSDGVDGFTTSQALLIGLGSTAAIALQTAVLVPFLRQAGFHFKPRFDFRGVGLSHTLRLALWTLGFIVVNQIAYIVIIRLGNRATLQGAASGEDAAGSYVYGLGFLVSQVPHGVITVSLATAIIPMLSSFAADREFARFRVELARTVRLALVIIVPLAVAVACLGQQIATITNLAGNLEGGSIAIGWAIQAFAIAMVAFTVHYLMLRGFYANEDTRTPFYIQVVIAAVNIVTAIALTSLVEPARVAMMLAFAFGIAYVVGSILSTTVLSRTVGSIVDREMLVFAGKLIVAAIVSAAAMLASAAGLESAGLDQSEPSGGLPTAFIAGTGGAIAYVIATKLLRMDQLSYLVKTLRRRS